MTDIGELIRNKNIEKWANEIPDFRNYLAPMSMDIMVDTRKD